MIIKKHLVSVVVPVYNENETIKETIHQLLTVRKSLEMEADVELIMVDDGSKDNSLTLMHETARKESCLKVVSLSRNFGHQIAITAGLDFAKGDYVAIIDADLQDPPGLIPQMYRMAISGYDVIYGKRRSRAGETVFKKVTAKAFYRLMSWLCEEEIPPDTGDFRLMSRKIVDAFKKMPERHRFVRGMVPWLGFKATALEYDRAQRFAGETKYPLKKMLAFATNAILSFSSKPLALAIRLGLFTIFVGLAGGVYMLYLKLFTETPTPGLTAILVSIILFSGVQILLIGTVGQYIARIYEEVKRRPLYVISETINL